MVSHKCRSTLGKTKLMKNDEKVLCVFHGDQASIALSSLLKRGTDEKTHKRIRFRTVFLFIDGKFTSNFFQKPRCISVKIYFQI